MSFIKEVYGYVETKDNGQYMLSGDKFITIRPGHYDSDEHDTNKRFYIYDFLRFVEPKTIIGISEDESTTSWRVKFCNGTNLTLNSLNEVRNFLIVYQMLRDQK